MNGGMIWWGQIGNSLRFLNNVTNSLRDCQSAVLHLPPKLPWRKLFYEAVDVRRMAFSSQRRLVRLPWEEGTDPGEFVLERLCSNRVRAEYWPGMTYAAYLAAKNDIMLNDYYIWITGVHSKADLSKWSEFIAQYRRCSKIPEQRAVYVVEYDGAAVESFDLPMLSYSVESYDCRVFCLETAAALRNTEFQNYQAELALSIGADDPELCDALLATGKELLVDPLRAAQLVFLDAVDSEGVPFPEKTEPQINSAAWNAAIVLLFPVLEHYRVGFVSKYGEYLSRQLPISNSNGDRITDPFDLEIGAICFVMGKCGRIFQPLEEENIRLCRKVRNLLAHNKPLPYADARKVLSLPPIY